MIDSKSTAPGEVRGSGIEGGDTRQLSKGDVLIIPAGVPHWFKRGARSISLLRGESAESLTGVTGES